MNFKIIIIALFSSLLLENQALRAQQTAGTTSQEWEATLDSLEKIEEVLQAVVITATRTEKQLAHVNLPMQVISKSQIQQMGSLRLHEILQEQTGLTLMHDHGSGIQIQGFAPDYTLILIDGEPLIGRTAGTLELSRLAVGNIKQIEIVKGPSSSLYGSEALAGVINIITEKAETTSADLALRYGTNQTIDISTNLALKKKKWHLSTFLNRYASQGYDFTPESYGQTVEPFENYTAQAQFGYDFNDKVKFNISTRFFTENQSSRFDLGTNESPFLVSGTGKVEDFNFLPSFQFRLGNKSKWQLRYYLSSYKATSNLVQNADNQLFEETFFTQTFARPELQGDYFFNDKHTLTLGLGRLDESVEATRYAEKQRFYAHYGYLQYDFTPNEKFNILIGSRIDAHSVYGNQLSPKLSFGYQILPRLWLKTSLGRGFKAPDFRQLYLNFNNAVAGYSVYGSEEIANYIQEMGNQIADVFINFEQMGVLKAERSMAYNVGFQLDMLKDKIKIETNFFRNDIQDLIETQVVARTQNGQNIFSYLNKNSVLTQGVELNLSYKATPTLSFSAGYQYLQTADKDVLAQIRKGELFARDPETLQTRRLTRASYGGLFNRSKHLLNLKVFYQNPKNGLFANLRCLYRGRYGFADRNGNLVLDAANEYIAGYTTWQAALGKNFFRKKKANIEPKKQWGQLQIGGENLLNFTNQTYIPSLAGRLLYIRTTFFF
ncbi:TonB-dependent receptor plug domain-containing protein [Hugenholtzia roseola]|uniref:TonB-dependent receptor plug domain-containing protein n=1 Tax=Hugenholtzia roseola TaxID=1002 RepID=UPI000688ED54|nr:TonB-dependent receptor [Hugenholtzia roseola]